MRTPRLPLALCSCLALAASPACGDDDGGTTPDTGPGNDAAVDGGPRDAGTEDARPDTGTEDPWAARRAACEFAAGARVADTLGTTELFRAAIPVTHVVVIMQENRSFDHLFGRLSEMGQPDAEALPPGYTNPDTDGAPVAPFHLESTCLPADPPHQFDAMHAEWNMGAMDGFVRNAARGGSDGHYALGYYDGTDLPFYYWLASTYALADRYFSSALSGTWANRDYLYAASSYGVHDTGERVLTDVRTLFDQLDEAGVAWGSYSDGNPRQDCLGWNRSTPGVGDFADFLAGLADGSLPPVAFLDPGGAQDEHPPNDMQGGEAWLETIYRAATESPLWSRLVIFFTYDESGGLFDHVPPPEACLASPDQTEFDRLGIRVPLIVISPFARPHHVSHVVHEHTSIVRFVQLLHDLPALTARDANSDALLDLLDFGSAPAVTPTAWGEPGTGGCP